MKLLLRKIRDKIQKEYPTYSKEEIEEVMVSQFSFVESTIKKGKLEPVRLQYLGKFEVLPKKKKIILERRKNKDDT